MKRYLVSTLATSLLAFTMLTPALAHKTIIYGEPMSGTLTTPSNAVFESLLIQTDNGFEAPVIGETHDDEVLYNIPVDGSDPVPLRQVPTLYITDRDMPVVIDESIGAPVIDMNGNVNVRPTTRGLVYPANPSPITFGDWIGGHHSTLKIKVKRNGHSKVTMKLRGLLPNSLYGVWQFNPAGPPGPFGGIPNILTTDKSGNATMKRELPFNLNEVADSLVLVYHSDHRVYGGVPSLLRSQGGPDMHFQLQFNIMGEQ
ncbi:MAG: hypothetical protein L3J89_03020 [Gammaproteobacteria bacterium]|nr:hypothetical protein [Gammaproteobacteria bacterium]